MGRKHRIYNDPQRVERRKQLRNWGTPAEAVLWKNLQRQQLLGKKFRRQVSIGPYIVDFYCPECGVIVELDGDGHYSLSANEYDAERTAYFQKLGLRVIRFENKDVHQNLPFLLHAIEQALHTPS